MSQPPAPLRIETVDEVAVASFTEPAVVDPVVIGRMGRQLYDLIEQEGRGKIVVDFSNLRFLSSQLLGVLLTLRKKADAAGAAVGLCGIQAELHKVFRITKLDSFFEFHPTRREAIDALTA